MLIRDIILREGYADELVNAVRDAMATLMADDVEEIATEDLKARLAEIGFITTTDELIQAVDQSGFSSSVDKNTIKPADAMPDDLDTEDEPAVDVGKMAGKQAMKGVKSDI